MRGPFWWRRRRQEALAEEIETHLALATQAHVERGLPPDRAREAALREFGNVPLVQQTAREMSPWTRVEQWIEDARMGARVLQQAPGTSLTAIVLIALVIGGNTTIYSMVNSLLVSPAPGVTASRLVVVKHQQAGIALTDPFVSFPNYEAYARSTTLAALAAWSSERLTLRSRTGSYAVNGGLVTGNYFDTLGVAVAHGRPLDTADDVAGGEVAAVISDRVWREQFDGSSGVIGASAVVNDTPVTIVGVAPPRFQGALRTPGEDVWLPIRAYYTAIGSGPMLADRSQTVVLMAGRLADGASVRQARAALGATLGQLYAAYPNGFTTIAPQGGRVPLQSPRVAVAPYSGQALLPFADLAPRFLAAFSVVTLITLVVVSANVANLLLARAVHRQRDTAVRQSLGAPRLRILRTVLAEGATLALIAGAIGWVCALWTGRAVLHALEPRPGLLADVAPGWTVAGYAMLLAAVATLAFSLAPALRVWGLDALPLLKSGEHTTGTGRPRLGRALVVCQFAFAVLLVTSAGLASRALTLFDRGDVGFKADGLLLATVRAAVAGAFVTVPSSAPEIAAGYARLEDVREELAQVPGVTAVSYVRRIPGDYFNATWSVWREAPALTSQALVRPVGPEYLRTLGLAPVAGRDLSGADRHGATRVAVINRTLAAQLFPDTSPLGHTIWFGAEREAVEVVGVAPDALFDGPVHDPHPRYVFIAEQQLPGPPASDPTFLVRHLGTSDAVAPQVARRLAQADASLPIISMTTMRARLDDMGVFETFLSRLVTAFAAISLLIAVLGQYAAATFDSASRRRDFGVRLALGASVSQVQRFVLRDSLQQVGLALVVGFALSAGVAVVFRSVLLDVSPLDPATYGGVALLLLVASLAASAMPAWRAGRVNVIEVLRQE